MTLDDRLRGAYRQNLSDVRDRVDGARFEPGRSSAANPWTMPSRSLPKRLGGLALAASVLVLAGFGLFRLVADGEVELVGTDSAGGEEPEPGVGHDSPQTLVIEGEDEPSTTAKTTGASEAGPAGTDTPDGDPTVSEPDRSQPEPVESVEPEPAAGVATTVCPTGRRAELEEAELTYVGQNQGWGRKDDLVDEQDGPYFFEAWEPNYELPVAVQLVLDRPVLATDIRVHQDPFTPVSGVISLEIEVDGETEEIGIELSGTDGWRVHTFERPKRLARFTIRRDTAGANIMEVMICVAAEADS